MLKWFQSKLGSNSENNASETPFQNKSYVTTNGRKVHVEKVNITHLEVDVIVNAANGKMRNGGGVARTIANAGGRELTQECQEYIKKYKEIPVTELCKTTSGEMRSCQYVYHAVGPRWSDYSNKEKCLDDLLKTVYGCLVKAEEDRYKKIAFPAISSAKFAVPKESCARMYAEAVRKFDSENGSGYLKEIYFVDIYDKMLQKIQDHFDEKFEVKPDSRTSHKH